MSKSRKTTISGLIAALGAAIIAFGEATGQDWSMIGAAVSTLGIAFLGFFSRDDDVSSEGTTAPKNE